MNKASTQVLRLWEYILKEKYLTWYVCAVQMRWRYVPFYSWELHLNMNKYHLNGLLSSDQQVLSVPYNVLEFTTFSSSKKNSSRKQIIQNGRLDCSQGNNSERVQPPPLCCNLNLTFSTCFWEKKVSGLQNMDLWLQLWFSFQCSRTDAIVPSGYVLHPDSHRLL